MSAWGLDGGGPLNAQQVETSSSTSSRSRSPARTATPRRQGDPLTARPATSRPRSRRRSSNGRRSAVEDGEYGRSARRCSTSNSPAAPTAAPVATPPGGATATRRAGPGRSRLEPHRWRRRTPTSRTRQDMIDFISNGSVNGAGYGSQGQGAARCRASGRCSPTSRSTPSSTTCGVCRCARRLAIVAISWEPELRGILIVDHRRRRADAARCTSSSATNLGARLGFLVGLAGLAGWMALMGVDLVIYGIGLQGPRSRRGRPWPGGPCSRTPPRSSRPGCSTSRRDPRRRRRTPTRPTSSPREFVEEGWDARSIRHRRRPVRPAPRPASSSRRRRLRRRRVRGDRASSTPVASATRMVGERSTSRVLPQAALRRRRGRPARADTRRARPGGADERRSTRPSQRQYVYMIRDLGARRQPAVVLAIGGDDRSS